MIYRDYIIQESASDLPCPGTWYEYAHKDYDGIDDTRHGYEASPKACQDAIDDHLDPSTPPTKQPKEGLI